MADYNNYRTLLRIKSGSDFYDSPNELWAEEISNNQVFQFGSIVTITYTYLQSLPSYYAGRPESTPTVFETIGSNVNLENGLNILLGNSGTAFEALFEDVANIVFSPVSNEFNANNVGAITFGQSDGVFDLGPPIKISSAYSWGSYQNSEGDRQGDVWVNKNDFGASDDFMPGTFSYLSLMHEIGHALGLEHSFLDGFSSKPHLSVDEDNRKFSIMSYDPENSSMGNHPDMDYSFLTNGDFHYSLGLYDIAALQAIYGADMTTRAGDTTYKIGQGFQDADTPFIYTIWDGGRNDTIDARGYADGVEIDLREGHFSSIGRNGNPDGSRVVWDSSGYDAGNVAIAYGAKIENVIGTEFDDRFIGNQENNHFIGGAGNDEIHGDSGIDTLDYSSDAAYGGAQRVVVNEFVAREGTVIDGFGNTDTFYGIENFTLTAGNDQIYLKVPIGQRTIEGGDGTDDLFYSSGRYDVTTGVYSDLSGTYKDTINHVENISMLGGTIVLDMTQDYLFTPQYQYSYAKATQGLDITITNSGHFTASGSGTSATANFSQSVYVEVDTGAATHSGTVTSRSAAGNFSDVVQGAYDPLADMINQFVKIERQGRDAKLSIDADGADNGNHFTTLAIIEGGKDLTLETLLQNGGLVV